MKEKIIDVNNFYNHLNQISLSMSATIQCLRDPEDVVWDELFYAMWVVKTYMKGLLVTHEK